MSKIKIDLVTALAETFGRQLSVPAAKLYVASLSGISDDDAKRAASVAIQTCKFFPSAAELIEFVSTGGVSYSTQAQLAFEQLDLAIDTNRPSTMSPLVAAVAKQMGGFDALRRCSLDEFYKWKRKEFLSAYATLSRENPERVALLAGPGSEIGAALGEKLRLKGTAATEATNRKMLEQLK